MSRILLDENISIRLVRKLPHLDMRHVSQMGWQGVSNGALIVKAEAAEFDVLVTADRNLRYQQNMEGRRLAIVVLPTNHWKTVEAAADLVAEAIARAVPGGFLQVSFPVRPSRRTSRGV